MKVHRSVPRTCWVATALAALLLAGCAGSDGDAEATGEQQGTVDPAPDDSDDSDDSADAGEASQDAEPADPEPAPPAVDPAEVGADELGQIPVLMYHQLRDGGGSEWDMSQEEFRAELTQLFAAGYVPIRVIDLARGEIDVPAGSSPVVLTFDDSTRSQAYLDEDGNIAPDSSIGILIEVAAEFDVDPVASLYVITSSLFGGTADGPDIVAHLHELGMEIGNHSHTHPNLRSLDAARVQDELATNVAEVRSIVPDAEVATLSLPLGIFPEDSSLAVAGSSPAGSYANEGVLLVGYNPAPSPFAVGFDPLAIPRIQTHPDVAYQFGSAWWLEQLEAGGSNRRYVSDGNPDTISFPADRADDLDPAFADRANPY